MVKDNVILIAGAKRSGKDTVADMLAKKIKGSYRLSYAEPMKDIVYEMLGLTFDEGEALKNSDSNPHRGYLQRFGQKAKQYFGANCWGEIVEHTIANLPKGSTTIISDFRVPVEHIKGSLTIKIVNPKIKDIDVHISERALDNFEFDVLIYNSGTLKELEAKVDTLIKDLHKTEWIT